MSKQETVPSQSSHFPVRTLRVEVVEGPDAGKRVTSGADRLSIGTATGNDFVLTDATVSRFHVELRASGTGALVRDLGSTNGTLSGPIRLEQATVPPGTVLKLGRTRVRVDDGETVRVELHDTDRLGDLHGRSPAIRRVMARVAKAAPSEGAVLVLGESGTGKEVVSRTIHDLSPRSTGPFATVDCGAIVPSLVSSELFGHERGAFTGADRRYAGAFERANGGTVFLDEIAELPSAVQTTLLGVLERRRFRRVGGSEELSVDVRVVAATNRDLRDAVNNGAFRLDLYYRLAVVVIEIPPLRERAEDVPILLEHFLRENDAAERMNELFPAATIEALSRLPWPGNIRELRNLVESTLAMGEMPAVAPAAIGAQEEAPSGTEDPIGRRLEAPYSQARGEVIEEFERRYLVRLMERAGGNVSRASREAAMNRSHLIELLRKHRIR